MKRAIATGSDPTAMASVETKMPAAAPVATYAASFFVNCAIRSPAAFCSATIST